MFSIQYILQGILCKETEQGRELESGEQVYQSNVSENNTVHSPVQCTSYVILNVNKCVVQCTSYVILNVNRYVQWGDISFRHF